MPQLARSDYARLVEKIRKNLAAGRSRAEEAVDFERDRTYWENGHDIHKYLLHGNDRAKYGEQLFESLAEEFRMARSLVQEMHICYQAFPIRHARDELTWTNRRLLARIKDKNQRDLLAKRVAREKWKSRQLEAEIRRLKLPVLGVIASPEGAKQSGLKNRLLRQPFGLPRNDGKPLVPRRGEFFHYKVVRSQDLHLGKEIFGLDLGFGNKHFPANFEAGARHLPVGRQGAVPLHLKEGEILHAVRIKENPAGDQYCFERAASNTNRTPSGTFFHTYQAWVKNVVDDDSVPRKAAQEMRAGPSKPICRNGLQSTLSGFG